MSTINNIEILSDVVERLEWRKIHVPFATKRSESSNTHIRLDKPLYRMIRQCLVYQEYDEHWDCLIDSLISGQVRKNNGILMFDEQCIWTHVPFTHRYKCVVTIDFSPRKFYLYARHTWKSQLYRLFTNSLYSMRLANYWKISFECYPFKGIQKRNDNHWVINDKNTGFLGFLSPFEWE